MKLALLIGIGVAGVVGVGAAVFIRAGSVPELAIVTSENGLTSLKADNVEFVQDGNARVEQVRLRKVNGDIYDGSTQGTSSFDQSHRELTITYPWGIVTVKYATSNNRLTMT